jgi:alkylhydroperoxidase family enzyme
MVRIPVVPPAKASRRIRLTYRYLKRRFGEVPEPFAVLANHPRLVFANAAHEAAASKATNVLPPSLSDLAVYRVALTIGCSWCMDFGAMMHRLAGLDVDQLRHIDGYATSPTYTDDERAVIAYAEAMTATPPEVTDEQVADLRRRLGDAGVVELTYQVAHENMRSRMNSALGITAQGFSTGDGCRVPWADTTDTNDLDQIRRRHAHKEHR